MNSSPSCLKIPEDILFRELEGEAVLLNLKSGVYFGLDPIGTRIWRLIQEKERLEAILQVLVQEYDVEEKKCREDLLHLFGELKKNGLVEVADAP